MIVAVVLAAGVSTRMGRLKQTLPVRGKPMLEKVLEALRRSKVDKVVVVLGAGADEVKKKVRFKDETDVINRDYRSGMSGSLKLGLSAAGAGADAAIITLADQPFLSPKTFDSLVEAYWASKALVVVPVYHGTRGNPVLFDRIFFAEIMNIRGDVGAKSVVKNHNDDLSEVKVEDRGVVLDIDTPSDYRKATSIRAADTRRKASNRNT